MLRFCIHFIKFANFFRRFQTAGNSTPSPSDTGKLAGSAKKIMWFAPEERFLDLKQTNKQTKNVIIYISYVMYIYIHILYIYIYIYIYIYCVIYIYIYNAIDYQYCRLFQNFSWLYACWVAASETIWLASFYIARFSAGEDFRTNSSTSRIIFNTPNTFIWQFFSNFLYNFFNLELNVLKIPLHAFMSHVLVN